MRRLIIALILGLAMGYNWGYDDSTAGKPAVLARVLDHFGVSKLKADQAEYDQRVQDATRP